MKRSSMVLGALLVVLAALPCLAQDRRLHNLRVPCEAVEKALAPENLKAMAAKIEDPDVLLGLAILVHKDVSVRREILHRAAQARPQYATVAVVVAVTTDGPDEETVEKLVESDADNALGHYLHANLLYESGREKESLEAFRKAAGCSELRLYEDVTSQAIFKALDELNLTGRERLCALSWVATRAQNFAVFYIQSLYQSLAELARNRDHRQRDEISDWLLILAGHLYDTNFGYRWYAQRALEFAFRMKAEVAAAEQSPKMSGYAAVTQALVSTRIAWPEIAEGVDAVELARLFPTRVCCAFYSIERKRLPDGDQTEKELLEAAEELIKAAANDPDAIIGAYLRGHPPDHRQAGPWRRALSSVERLMHDNPEIFRIAARYENSLWAALEARQDESSRQNLRRMMSVGVAILNHAFRHDGEFPPNLDALEPPVEAKSLLSGRPYVYVAAGETLPEKSRDATSLIILYDDHELDGHYHCIMADSHGEHVPADVVKQQLKARGKLPQ